MTTFAQRPTQQAMSANSDNPYDYTRPTPPGRQFFGRKGMLDQIRAHLDQPVQLPLLLVGQAHSGKSSLLQQLNQDKLGHDVTAVLIDLQATAVDNLNDLVWYITQTLLAQAQLDQWPDTDPSLDTLRSDFATDPLLAFQNHCLQPLTQIESASRLLFLWDNLDALLPGLDNGLIDADKLNRFCNLLLDHQIALVFTCTASGKASLTQHLPILYESPVIQIGPLSQEAALDLIQQPVNYAIVSEVAEYIYELTQGNPYQIQRLCYYLQQYRQAMALEQLTVADIVHVASDHLPEDKDTSVARKSRLPAYVAVEDGRFPLKINWRWLLILAGLILLLVAGLILAYPVLSRQTDEPPVETDSVMAALLPQDDVLQLVSPTVTATATQTPIPIPTSTPTSLPTDTPTITPTASATPTPTPTVPSAEMVRQNDGMVMLYIPPGTYLRGAAEDDPLAEADERPRHEVSLDGFYIDKYEVSVAQYAFFLNQLGGYEDNCNGLNCALTRPRVGNFSYLDEQDLGDGVVQFMPVTGYANYPINHVNWYGAAAYCEAMGARLPTEAEWEYAARGTDGRLYPWGDEPPDKTRAVFYSESYDELLPVDALPDGVSPFGVYGLAGSMWEWVADWYDERYYQDSPRLNPPGPETGLYRVIRGGAWANNNRADRIRASNRSAATPDLISSTIGFRCAYDP
jgi:formylglycine-generating enzyme required for sulfatase activity